MTLLEVKKLKKSYGQKTILHSLSFGVKKGEVVGLLGPNGAGKTTAFYLTMGLISPDSGSVIFSGSDITNKPIHERAKMGMGYLAQEPSVFRQLSVEDNILCILEMVEKDPKVRKERLKDLLQELRLDPLAKKKACTLSGGERRRLEITRALVTKPSLLLLDEPFANIDPITIADVKKMIRLLKEKGISVLITDHNAREIFSIVDTSYLIQDGAVTLSGSVDELMSSKVAKSTYLGEDFTL
ncbi:MAG: Lipopolysaccharide export system ATP-binding protein LptB [Chlamydiia bacterium]|nr:Lipopolysaccharide export system ATP-binding protein LptB [Chlamydiia bacterium]